jgi:hypothetical protein
MYTAEYFIPIENFTINSDADYACLFLATVMFEPNTVRIPKSWNYDAGITRNGLVFHIQSKRPIDWEKFSSIFHIDFNLDQYYDSLIECENMPDDTYFKRIENQFAKEFLPKNKFFPQENLTYHIYNSVKQRTVEKYYKNIQNSNKIQLSSDRSKVHLSELKFDYIKSLDNKRFGKKVHIYTTNQFIPLDFKWKVSRQVSKKYSTIIRLHEIYHDNKIYFLVITPKNQKNYHQIFQYTISKLGKYKTIKTKLVFTELSKNYCLTKNTKLV